MRVFLLRSGATLTSVDHQQCRTCSWAVTLQFHRVVRRHTAVRFGPFREHQEKKGPEIIVPLTYLCWARAYIVWSVWGLAAWGHSTRLLQRKLLLGSAAWCGAATLSLCPERLVLTIPAPVSYRWMTIFLDDWNKNRTRRREFHMEFWRTWNPNRVERSDFQVEIRRQ
jgi:hypothetical protein